MAKCLVNVWHGQKQNIVNDAADQWWRYLMGRTDAVLNDYLEHEL